MADENQQADLLDQFVALTGTTIPQATEFLVASHWNLEAAATEYYTSQEEALAAPASQANPSEPEIPENYTGPRTLDGRPAPAAIPTVGSSARGVAPPRRGGIATLGSLNQDPHAGHRHAHDDDDSDDEFGVPEQEPRDLFAGGEKSGLAVQDPNKSSDPRKVVNDILKKARANAARPGGEPTPAPPTRFRGSGQTLGGDDVPSQTIPDPNPRAPETGEVQTRVLHLWEEGFSIEDGPLRRFDDPANNADLQLIRQGRAPLHLMGVTPNQPVDVQLIKHDEKYKAPPKVYKPFSGGGHRLGSPVIGESAPTPVPSTTTTATAPLPVQEPSIDSAQPTLSLRIQLADGTRLPARFNTTNTVGDVYRFISRAFPGSNERPWVLATTFPNKEHVDKSLVLGEMAEFKRGGTAVMKWV